MVQTGGAPLPDVLELVRMENQLLLLYLYTFSNSNIFQLHLSQFSDSTRRKSESGLDSMFARTLFQAIDSERAHKVLENRGIGSPKHPTFVLSRAHVFRCAEYVSLIFITLFTFFDDSCHFQFTWANFWKRLAIKYRHSLGLNSRALIWWKVFKHSMLRADGSPFFWEMIRY